MPLADRLAEHGTFSESVFLFGGASCVALLDVQHWDTIAAERRVLADLLESLNDQQWATPSLCSAWTVRDVAAHLVGSARPGAMRRLLPALLGARGSFERANQAMVARQASRPTEELIGDLRTYATRQFAPPGLGSVAPLTELLVHGADIRVPLGLADEHAPEAWRPVLEFVASPKARRGFVPRPLPNLCYYATDLGWAHGEADRDAVGAPAATMALAMLGRSIDAGVLTGPGAGTLSEWATR